MRKRTIGNLFDSLFWYLIYSIPLFAIFSYIKNINTGIELPVLSEYFSSLGLGFVSDNLVVNTLTSLFGSAGSLPLFSTDIIFIIVGWFICTFLVHLAVDILLFIPRFAHKFMSKATQGD